MKEVSKEMNEFSILSNDEVDPNDFMPDNTIENKQFLLDKIVEIIVDPPTLYDETRENSTHQIEMEALSNPNFKKFLSETINYYLIDFSKDQSFVPFIARDIFTMIGSLELANCRDALFLWLQSNCRMTTSTDVAIKTLYLEALQAFCVIQSKHPYVEFFWENLWRDGDRFFWKIAFVALLKQDVKKALSYVGQLVIRFGDDCAPIVNHINVEHNKEFVDFLKKAEKLENLQWFLKVREILSKTEVERENTKTVFAN